jgi:hypothetical protein
MSTFFSISLIKLKLNGTLSWTVGVIFMCLWQFCASAALCRGGPVDGWPLSKERPIYLPITGRAAMPMRSKTNLQVLIEMCTKVH